ncbi:MAG: hypothetical protein GY825_07840, partial [Phycisphaeraceae bacterium]|nr:hypothetical protein [Phycisphaeraceae bacterium]
MKASRKRTARPIRSILLLTLLTLPLPAGCNGTETSSVAAPIRMSKGVEQVRSWLCGRFETDMPASGISESLRIG